MNDFIYLTITKQECNTHTHNPHWAKLIKAQHKAKKKINNKHSKYAITL